MLILVCMSWMYFPAAVLAAPLSAEEFNASSISNELWTGAVVMIGTPDTVLFMQAWGWMDKSRDMPMPVDAVFDLASVTKAVGTATALAVCMDKGLIDPDSVFTNYLPQYAGELKGAVSVRDLARHISGFSNGKPYAVAGEVTERIMRFSPVLSAGETYEYSCGNFILLGLIAEHVAKEDLAELCHKNVFMPLGMDDTGWGPLQNPEPERVVRQGITHTLGVASDMAARQAQHPLGNAGLFSTAEDLSVFCRMILGNGVYKGKQILSSKAVHLLGFLPDKKSPVAFGWRVGTKFNPRPLSSSTMSHTGWAGSSLWIDHVSQRYVIVLTNRIGNHAQASSARIKLAEYALNENVSSSAENPQ
ncbi:MAG: serine hydrolase domain-containing protein [Kiritimatiellia bacterium]